MENFLHQRAETFGPYLEKHSRKRARQQGDRRIAGPQNDGNDGLVCREGNAAAPGTACRGEFAPQHASLGWWAYRGVEAPNATHCATHSDRTAQKRRKLANYRPKFTDKESVFLDFAVRYRGGGEHDGLAPYVERPCSLFMARRTARPAFRALSSLRAICSASSTTTRAALAADSLTWGLEASFCAA